MQADELSRQRAKLWARATAALARREHSVHELRRKLKTTDTLNQVDEVMHALLKDDLVSDERFAHMLCRSRYTKGVGPVRIEHELNQHQIECQWIEEAMQEYERSWIERLQTLKTRKYGDTPPADYKSWAKQARFFQQRGFTSTQIQRAIPR